MDVILREDIVNVGSRGEVVNVAAGYARNFLLPKRMAVAESNVAEGFQSKEKRWPRKCGLSRLTQA